jgi:hypothetical protein
MIAEQTCFRDHFFLEELNLEAMEFELSGVGLSLVDSCLVRKTDKASMMAKTWGN